jgi:recombination protein RecT
MTIDQIHKAWNQGATKGGSPAHRNFPAEMCKKTVIGRACKMIINSSDDAWLYEGKHDEDDAPEVDTAKEQRHAILTEEAVVIEEPIPETPKYEPEQKEEAEEGPGY